MESNGVEVCFPVFAIRLPSSFSCRTLGSSGCAEHRDYTQNLSIYIAFFKNPGFHTCFGLNLNPRLKNNIHQPCFGVKTVFHTKLCFTHKPCYTVIPCSCWACANAVCSLQESSKTMVPSRRRLLNYSGFHGELRWSTLWESNTARNITNSLFGVASCQLPMSGRLPSRIWWADGV